MTSIKPLCSAQMKNYYVGSSTAAMHKGEQIIPVQKQNTVFLCNCSGYHRAILL